VGDAAATLIQSLRTAAAFPHPVTAVELHETHISWVLLTGPFAYKIKKPVNLGFVDFTSLSRRRFFCEEELRLNRRLAPDLYLDVLPICGTERSPRIGGTGPSLEWCVRMRQFDQDCLLTRIVRRGPLDPRQIDALARQIAEFHANIPVAAPESPFGTPTAVAEPIRANFEHLERLDSPAERDLVRRLLQWCKRELQRQEEVLTARKSGGFIRECHGDMHLGNMILDKESITIFDCIEFNESLRWIDVMSEVAFCTMDLEDHGRTDFAWRFLNSALDWSGDYAGLRVFPLYFTYRALVRAKVAQIRRNQTSLAADEIEQASNAVSNYLNLAGRSLDGRPRFLAITHGLSGSGKTRGTQSLLEHCGAIRLRSDVERKRLAGLGPLAHTSSELASGLYSPEFSRRTFDRLADLSSTVVDAGFPVILDATFLRRAEREQFRALADSLGVPFVILDFPADEATCRERVRRRMQEKADASEATEQVVDRQLRLREPLSDQEQCLAVQFDPERTQLIEALLARLMRAE
jgi:aminoglycoside phosphotransferase family enzyme/predicted kinase